jgi:hypothetical protein
MRSHSVTGRRSSANAKSSICCPHEARRDPEYGVADRRHAFVADHQFFGRVDIDGRSDVMMVTLKDIGDQDLWSVNFEPRPGRILAQHI